MDSVYLKEVNLKDFRCFKGNHKFVFIDENDNWCRWTVFLGDNNTGKTNLLKAIATLGIFKEARPNPIKLPTELNNIFLKENGSLDADYITSNKEIFHSGIPFAKGGSYSEAEFPPVIYGYGVNRTFEKKGLSDTDSYPWNLFDSSKLINFEDWLFQLDYAVKNTNSEILKKRLNLLKSILTSKIFPEIVDIEFRSNESAENYLEFKMADGWHRISEIGYGYQATLSWLIDFCKKMFDQYPDSPNPLKEPAILLIDELDLHLHPQWQRNIVRYLSDIFTQTQFIVTTHSPFIIQSMEKVNLYTLTRVNDCTEVSHLGVKSYIGWRIEEILSEVMGLEDNILTDKHQELNKKFDEALNEDNFPVAKLAYNQLNEIIHPESVEHKLMEIQLSQLTHEND